MAHDDSALAPIPVRIVKRRHLRRHRRWLSSIDSDRSWLSKDSRLSIMSLGAELCIGSAGSLLSVGSAGSMLSIGSAGSILSIGSAGSILSYKSAGSILSVRSAGSILTTDRVFAIGDHRVDDNPQGDERGTVVTRLATFLAVAGLLGATLER